MKSITWTRPFGEFDLRDEELSPRDPDTETTIERPAVTVEMLEHERRTREAEREDADSSEHRVLQRMSSLYAKYDTGPYAAVQQITHRNLDLTGRKS